MPDLCRKVNNSIFGIYLNKLLDGIHWGEAESLANFEELLESYPYCHLLCYYPPSLYYPWPSMDYMVYDREQTNKRQYLDYYNLPLQLRDHFFWMFFKN